MDNHILDLAAGYFKTHPSVKEFHFTSDEQAFENPDHADAHSQSLKDKTINIITREQALGSSKKAATVQNIAPETVHTVETETQEANTQEADVPIPAKPKSKAVKK